MSFSIGVENLRSSKLALLICYFFVCFVNAT